MGIAAGSAHTVVLLEGAVPVARLLNPTSKGGQFSALQQTVLRKSYVLESTDSVRPTNWTPLSTNDGNGALTILTNRPDGAPQRYYRTRQW
jgi:hypothetical protein